MTETFDKILPRENRKNNAEDIRKLLEQETVWMRIYLGIKAPEERRTLKTIEAQREFANANARIMFLGREIDPTYRQLLRDVGLAFNICPTCGKFSERRGINDSFEFDSRECDRLDTESTPKEREERKREALRFYEDHLEKTTE